MIEVVRPERATQAVTLQVEAVASYDLLISLAAAANTGRFEMPASWARQVRQALPAALRPDMTLFFHGQRALGVGLIQLISELPGAGDPAVFLQALHDLETADLIAGLLEPRPRDRTVRAALRRMARGKDLSESEDRALKQHAASLGAELRKRFWEILHRPEEMRRRYLALVQAHHDGWFAARYPEVQPIVLQRAKQGRRMIGKLPAKEVIARLTGGFTLQGPAARDVTLIPSYYASPFVFIARDGREVILVYGVRSVETEGRRAPVAAHSVKVLKALADETRLRILQLLAERPLYGQQLAAALGVSHPTVSHHMAQLRIAGLTRTEMAEDGSQRYFVRPEALEELFGALRTAFMDPLPAARES